MSGTAPGAPVEFSLFDQPVLLLPQRALFWPARRTLVVADVHLGKAATFRAHGIPLPAGTTRSTLARLSAALTATSAERLLILGDLLHARAGRAQQMLAQVGAWRQQFHQLAVDLVLGNHDQQAGPPPDDWRMECAPELIEPPFVWRHQPGRSPDGYVLAGHVHPAVTLRGKGERLQLPCFYFGGAYGLLPAFGAFTGFGVIRPQPGEPVFVLADDELVQVA